MQKYQDIEISRGLGQIISKIIFVETTMDKTFGKIRQGQKSMVPAFA